MNILEYLYRRDNKGTPTYWGIWPNVTNLEIHHGIVGTEGHKYVIYTNRALLDEVQTRIKEKRKTGYKYLSEVKDNIELPVEGQLYSFLNKYLPINRTTDDGTLLPMLAKSYCNDNNKLFKNNTTYIGQWKINGLRCNIRAEKESSSLFSEVHLLFQSREGTYWNLKYLESYLLNIIPKYFIDMMLSENIVLDGELYLPGHAINEINHIIKDTKSFLHKNIQFWCYDLAIENMCQTERLHILTSGLKQFVLKHNINSIEHLVIDTKFNILPSFAVGNDETALLLRNTFIENKFEGLIMRNPNEEYQFGKRNLSMIKFKAHTDGLFQIIDIISEGIKRIDIPLFICKNDINDSTFKVHIGGTFDYQRQFLLNKEQFIGKYLHIEYGERSGIEQVPFHVKLVILK